MQKTDITQLDKTDASNTELVAMLATASALSEHFAKAEIRTLSQHVELERFRKNHTIVSQGEPAGSIIFIVSGAVRVVANEYQLERLETGDMFGESMFSEEGIRVADVISCEDTVIGVFTIEQYETLLRQSPRIALKYKQFFETVYHQHMSANDKYFHIDRKQYLALIAHDSMKPSLIAFVEEHQALVDQFPLVATGTTGQLLHAETGVVLSRKVKSGPLGGDQAIGNMISTDTILAVIFFRDPLSAHPHHADIEALGRLCDVYQIPFATNPTTAVAVLHDLHRNKESQDNQGVNEMRRGQDT